MKVQMKRWISLILAMVMVFTMIPQGTIHVHAEEEDSGAAQVEMNADNPWAGKTVSILSASTSTYAGVSNNTAANSTIGNNDVYYTEGRHGVYQKDMWWQQVIDVLDMELLVNNAWSGSCVFQPRKGAASVGYGDRAVNLHNDHTGEEPDIVWVYLGTNDFGYYKDTFGKAADVDYSALIKDNGDGTFTYADPTTTCEAYAIMLHKIQTRYSGVEIYCMTALARREPDYEEDGRPHPGQPTEYNAELLKVAAHMGCATIDWENCIPKEAELFDLYIGDKRAHPNAEGMDLMSQAILGGMLGEETKLYDVSGTYTSVYTDNQAAAAMEGGAYRANLSADNGAALGVAVTMGGVDVTSAVYANGAINIETVTGDIEITAVAYRAPMEFRWEIVDGQLVSVGEDENVLTALKETVTDGAIEEGNYQLAISVMLKHNQPWVMEWKCAGEWRGILLSTTASNQTNGRQYLARTKGGQLCFGQRIGDQSYNYGFDISKVDAQTHTYRLENRIAADGSNMVWLYLDGAEIGPMNNYFIGSKDQNTTSDWINGKDFTFSYIGTGTTPVTNCQLDYFSIQEGGHTHVYENGICTDCGDKHPNLANYEGKVISVMGDSISTFAGYTPVADGFNLEHRNRYPDTSRIPDVTNVNQTWWMQVVHELDARLGINDSWAGSTIYWGDNMKSQNADTGEKAAMASLTRIQNLGSNGTPDVIFLYGGGNDKAKGVTVGDFDPANIPAEVDLAATEWDTFADSCVAAIMRMQYYYPNAEIVVLMSIASAENDYIRTMREICDYFEIPFLFLNEYGLEADMHPDGSHPNCEGMDVITNAILGVLAEEGTAMPGENRVYSVTHELANAKAEKSYYKGVSAGTIFTESVQGDDLTHKVTMGGVDITADCYADGKITIDNVTGDLVIKATGRYNCDGHLQQLPENVCCDINLWTTLEPENIYYTVNGWGLFASQPDVHSVTFPVVEGERIWATSFGETLLGTGTRITWFSDTGVLKTVARDIVYAEFKANGYITVPVGATALNVPMGDASKDREIYLLDRDHTYENGVCTGCGEADPDAAEPLDLRYDDHYDVTGKTVEIVDAGKPTSYQVGYGVEENKVLDTAVVTLEGNYLVATGIGTAKVRIDGVLYEVTVTAAPISLLLLIGQSNMRGSEGNANQSIVCPDGMVYSTYGDDRGESNTAMTVSNATRFAPSALTGTYSSINVAGTTDCLSGYPVYSLTEAGAGKIGPDSGFAYEWVKQTGEKVWVVNAAHGGTSINVWQPGTTEYEQCQALFTACQETLRKEIAAGHFTLSHMAYFWCQGCSDRTQSAQWYVNKYLAMHSGLKTEMSFDHDSNADTADKTFEFGGIIPVRVGSTATCYRDGVYSISNPYAYHESFVDLRFSGPRVAQYWMINNPELSDIWGVCDIGDNWVWMPDGTNGVTEYFQSHYENGTVDYTTQVKQSASWYTPTTPKAVHDSIHYNQIGYNEYGREAVRNALIMLGEMEAPNVETTVELLSWDGYTPVEQVTASTAGNSGTLVVPKVYPIWKSKDIAYELSEGLTWDYYDLLAADVQTEGTLAAGGQTVCVAKAEPGAHYADHLSELPADICCGLNLWPLLEHESEFYYGGTHWAIHGTKDVRSVTIPVIPGDKVFATSFGKAGENGDASTSGIRVTFFSAYGVAKTMAPAETYAEFSANGGYLVAPENAIAINVAMWNNSDENELYLLDRAHDTDSGICGICGKDSHIHSWSGWQMKEIPGKGEPVTEERVCSGCGETETREVESVWQKYDLAAHYSDLPENVCSGLNLWNMLEHDKYYFASGTNWSIYSGGTVKSVTISVEPGDKIFATAFGKAGQNGHATSSGIRVTFFSAYGVAKTMAPAECYAEFSANGGYLVAPENAIAINVAMWNNSDDNELYILNREHTYENGICTGCGETIPQPIWEQGTILAASGLEKDYPNVIRTEDYLRLSDYVGMTLNADHFITYFVYDADYNYLGNGKADLTANFLLSGQGISTHEMLIHYPEGEYFRIALWRGKNGEMTPDMLDGAGVKFLDATHDPVFWEMGSIYAASGLAFVREQVIRSVNYLPVEDYAGVTVADGYAVSFLAYDENLNYLGNGNPEKKGYFIPGRVTMQEVVDQYPTTKYVRLLLAEDPIADITMETVELSEIRLYKAGETVPEKTDPYWGLASSFELDFAYGLLDVKNGTYHDTNSGFVTTTTIPLEHISKITWEDRYAVLWGAYNAQNEYLGACASYLTSGEIAKTDIFAVYGEASYVALSVKPVSQKNLELAEMVKESGITIHHDLSHTGAIAYDTVMQAQKSQDGAIYNNTLFLFNAAGKCTVFDIASKAKLGSFTLDKNSVLSPHANSVCFSDVFYEESDPFPLLYVNIYNNYWTTNDPKEGTCCVYRIFEENGTYSTKLVQVLKIGFTDDYDLWNSAEGNGYHYYLPYGNFIVDTDEDKLWAFVLRNSDNQTRFFKFDLPDMSDGIYNGSYGCNLVTLEASDIEDMFDLEHFEILQGCTYADGKIYSANGLGTSSSYNPFAELKVIDLRSKSVTAVVDFSTLGFGLEPEMISFNAGGDGQLYYLSIDGTLRRLRFVDAPLKAVPIGEDDHCYENGICTECGAEEPVSHIPGDITGDGEVNNKDVARLFKYFSDYDVEVVEAALDVNGDGEIDNKDLTRLFRYLSGHDVTIY